MTGMQAFFRTLPPLGVELITIVREDTSLGRDSYSNNTFSPANWAPLVSGDSSRSGSGSSSGSKRRRRMKEWKQERKKRKKKKAENADTSNQAKREGKEGMKMRIKK